MAWPDPSSKRAIPPKITAIKPAAGPFIETYHPLKNVVTIPPMIADNTPAMGSTSEATAIPNASGNATNATLNAAIKSLRQFSLRPLKPVDCMFESKLMIYNNQQY